MQNLLLQNHKILKGLYNVYLIKMQILMQTKNIYMITHITKIIKRKEKIILKFLLKKINSKIKNFY